MSDRYGQLVDVTHLSDVRRPPIARTMLTAVERWKLFDLARNRRVVEYLRDHGPTLVLDLSRANEIHIGSLSWMRAKGLIGQNQAGYFFAPPFGLVDTTPLGDSDQLYVLGWFWSEAECHEVLAQLDQAAVDEGVYSIDGPEEG